MVEKYELPASPEVVDLDEDALDGITGAGTGGSTVVNKNGSGYGGAVLS